MATGTSQNVRVELTRNECAVIEQALTNLSQSGNVASQGLSVNDINNLVQRFKEYTRTETVKGATTSSGGGAGQPNY